MLLRNQSAKFLHKITGCFYETVTYEFNELMYFWQINGYLLINCLKSHYIRQDLFCRFYSIFHRLKIVTMPETGINEINSILVNILVNLCVVVISTIYIYIYKCMYVCVCVCVCVCVYYNIII